MSILVYNWAAILRKMLNKVAEALLNHNIERYSIIHFDFVKKKYGN